MTQIGVEQRGGLARKGEQSWVDHYRQSLREKGWNFIGQKEGGINSQFIACHDEKTVPLLKEWGQTKDPVEMSIVIVPPNTTLYDLPARTLAYAASALNLATSLREKRGVNIDTVRIVSPSNINVYCNGGNLEQQLQNAHGFQRLVNAYKNNYHPQLDKVRITLDTGLSVTKTTEDQLLPKIADIRKNHPKIANDLHSVSRNYDLDGASPHVMNEFDRPLAYLLAHPEAWGYSAQDILFPQNGNRRINFVPSSELRYLDMMTEVGNVWPLSSDKQIATVVSAKQTRAPYYQIPGIEAFGGEPSISDLTKQGALEKHTGRLRQYSGRIEIAEVVTNLNQIKADVEQANYKRRYQGMGSPVYLDELITRSVL